MKVKELLTMLNGINPELEVMIVCNGGIYDSSLDGTQDMNDDEVSNEFYIAADTT